MNLSHALLKELVHLYVLSRSSFNQSSAQYYSQATGCFPTYSVNIIDTMDRDEGGMNRVAIATVNPQKEPGIEPATYSSQVLQATYGAMGLGCVKWNFMFMSPHR